MEHLVAGPESFEAYQRCEAGCASGEDICGYGSLLICRILPYVRAEEHREYFTLGHKRHSMDNAIVRGNFKLTPTERRVLEAELLLEDMVALDKYTDEFKSNPDKIRVYGQPPAEHLKELDARLHEELSEVILPLIRKKVVYRPDEVRMNELEGLDKLWVLYKRCGAL